jgi:AcrR family transcriptional regulator
MSVKTDDARERILDTAYELFCRHGIQAIGIDRIVAEAGVAKMSLYRHFGSKDRLARAVLERRQEHWTRGWLEPEVKRRGRTPVAQLLAIFDVFEEWFRRDDYESCLFINSLLESHDPKSPIGEASLDGFADVRSLLRELAEAAGARAPDEFAQRWQILMSGSIIAANYGNADAARHARDAAVLLLEREGLAA